MDYPFSWKEMPFRGKSDLSKNRLKFYNFCRWRFFVPGVLDQIASALTMTFDAPSAAKCLRSMIP